MVVGLHRRSVGVFSRRQDAESALHELKNSGFPMDRVSVIAQDSDRTIAGAEVKENVGNLADEGASLGAVSGGALGGLTGLLVGLGTLAIPGVGPVMLAGATATALATTLAGGAIGAAAGSLLGGLIGLGIPEEQAKSYNSRVEKGHYLIIIDGSDAEISQAEMILMGKGIEDYSVYEHPNRMEAGDYVAPVATSAVTPDYLTPPMVAPVGNSTLQRKRAIGVFSRRHDAEVALTELRDAGFDLSQVSLIGKDTSGNVADINVRGDKADEGAKTGAASGAAIGGLGGLLVGLGALAIPGIGPVILGGAAATALATTLTGGAIGAAAGSVVGGLVGLGIPENRAKEYSDRLNRGDYLVMVDGTQSEIDHAATILKRQHIENFEIFNATDIDTRNKNYSPSTHQNIASSNNAPVTIIDHRDETV
ncbi:general stress protein [Calothrix sp. PCC 6303]|uniref:general stress protein n=1 Tax=Calothrix sp. PCC 6303 TaxID=1170562 RepID=UPI0002A05306|nr:general stress protein [Calothrix sp. PCC 6303]AFZ01185.1 hypothetical protein Cal6303_2164 [Calothrix sp. PCC 6303]